MSELFTRIEKIYLDDIEIANYINELTQYHFGVRDWAVFFADEVEGGSIESDLEIIGEMFDVIKTNVLYVEEINGLDADEKLYDLLMLIGIYSLIDGYINSGLLAEKVINDIGNNAIAILTEWSQRHRCSYYYKGDDEDGVYESDSERRYISIIELQRSISEFYENRLYPLFFNTAKSVGVGAYAPEYYKVLKEKYGEYYGLYPTPGLVIYKDNVFDVLKNQLIRMPNDERNILCQLFERKPKYFVCKNKMHIKNLMVNGCVEQWSIENKLHKLYNKMGEMKGVLHLELTHKCNLNCKHCFNRTATRTSEISHEEWVEIINKFSQVGKYYTILFGGEPTLYSRMEELLAKLSEVEFPVELYTNATLIDAQYAKMLSKFNLNKVKISMDGRNSIRGEENYERSIRGLEALRDNTNIPIYVNYTICENNIDDIEEVIKICKQNGVCGIGFAPMQGIGNAKENGLTELDVMEEVSITSAIVKLGEKYGINVGMERFCEGPANMFRSEGTDMFVRATPCDIGIAMYYVRSDGLLCFCPDLTSATFSVEVTVDNIRKGGCNGLEELRVPTKVCGRCQLFYLCHGSCKATILRKYGTFNHCDEDNKRRIEKTLDDLVRRMQNENDI